MLYMSWAFLYNIISVNLHNVENKLQHRTIAETN